MTNIDTKKVIEHYTNLALELARDDKQTFIENFIKIEDKDVEGGVIPFNLWDKQVDVLDSIHQHKLNCILKARQLGLTWLVLAYAVSEMLGRENYSVIALSRTEAEAKELIRRTGFILKHMPELIRDKKDKTDNIVTYTQNTMDITIHFKSGAESTITAFASSSSATRSFTVNLIVFDEWAFQNFAYQIWASGYPTINRPSGGKVIGLSTIERGTLFEELFTNAPDNGFNAMFLPWDTDPSRTAEWYAETQKALGDAIMAEYPSSVEEALTTPGGSYFPEIKGHIHLKEPQEDQEGFRKYVTIDYGLDMAAVYWIWQDTEGNSRVYREYCKQDMTISEVCDVITRTNKDYNEDIYLTLAPPDLWNREQLTGRSRADIFAEYGVNLVKTSNNLDDGCAALKELFKHITNRDTDGNITDTTAKLTIDRDVCPVLFKSLTKIQKDKKRPNIYAKQPHDLTHSIDSIRCYAVYNAVPPKVKEEISEHDKYKQELIRKMSRRGKGRRSYY